MAAGFASVLAFLAAGFASALASFLGCRFCLCLAAAFLAAGFASALAAALAAVSPLPWQQLFYQMYIYHDLQQRQILSVALRTAMIFPALTAEDDDFGPQV